MLLNYAEGEYRCNHVDTARLQPLPSMIAGRDGNHRHGTSNLQNIPPTHQVSRYNQQRVANSQLCTPFQDAIGQTQSPVKSPES